MTRYVALGDSVSVGMGDPLPEGGGWRGWPAHLAAGLLDPELHNLADLGAQSHDVERIQLPAALDLRPDVASVVVGLNDTLRGGFDPARTGAAVDRIITALRAQGARVLTMRMPDPGAMLGLPKGLSRPLARRMRAVNAVVDEVAARHGVLRFDAAGDPACHERVNWSVDRLHPNERGHRILALRFHELLAASGYPVGPAPGIEPTTPPPTRAEEIRWMATKGTGWVLKRCTDLVPALLALTVHEWLTSGRGPEQAERPVLPGAEPAFELAGGEPAQS